MFFYRYGFLLLFTFTLCSLWHCVLGQTDEPIVKTNLPQSNVSSVRQARRQYNLADSCLTNGANTGTCMTRFKCMRQGGTANGYCGTYGVCCETNILCGQSSRLKRTIIKSPPTLSGNICQYIIEAYSPNVRQLRIDFEQFDLLQPSIDPTMPTRIECIDYFEAGKFKLCGANSGQHIYLPFNVAAGIDTILLQFNIPTQWAGTNWRLVVLQLEAPVPKRKLSPLAAFGSTSSNLLDFRSIIASHHADYDLLAPPGCDQFYTELTGTIKSFNYQASGTNYMPDTHYNICIKFSPTASMIEYDFSKFNLGIQTGSGSAEGTDEICHPTVHTEGHEEDYLMIPQSYLVQNSMLTDYQPTYYCGLYDNMIVYAYPPYFMHFSSDDLVYNVTKETGFILTYRLRSAIV